jgi:hypothetical protein
MIDRLTQQRLPSFGARATIGLSAVFGMFIAGAVVFRLVTLHAEGDQSTFDQVLGNSLAFAGFLFVFTAVVLLIIRNIYWPSTLLLRRLKAARPEEFVFTGYVFETTTTPSNWMLGSPGRRRTLTNGVTVSESGIRFWEGVLRPRLVVEIPRERLVGVTVAVGYMGEDCVDVLVREPQGGHRFGVLNSRPSGIGLMKPNVAKQTADQIRERVGERG